MTTCPEIHPDFDQQCVWPAGHTDAHSFTIEWMVDGVPVCKHGHSGPHSYQRPDMPKVWRYWHCAGPAAVGAV